jgi:hypothetical protein
VNLKGQQFGITATAYSDDYKDLLGNLIQRELGSGIGGGSPAVVLPEEFSGSTRAAYAAAEYLVAPKWVRGRSGNYTYYCVSTGLNHLDVNKCIDATQSPSSVRSATSGIEYKGNNWLGDQFVGEKTIDAEERKKNILVWLDSICLKKRVLFLHGLTDNVGSTKRAISYHDADMMATMPIRTSIPNGVFERKTQYRSSRTEIDYGNNIINESLADGIPVLMEQEFNDGQVRTEVVTWLPKLDIFVRRDPEAIQDDAQGDPRIGADANAHFTSWDACHQASAIAVAIENSRTFSDAVAYRHPRLSLYSDEFKRDENLVSDGAPTAPMNIKNVIIRPLTPSEDTLPSTRQEIIWKPPLGIFDVPHNIPTTTHELHMVIPNDYQTRCFDFGR